MDTSGRSFACAFQADSFCYICGKYMMINEIKIAFTETLQKQYEENFKIKPESFVEEWAPSCICQMCRLNLTAYDYDENAPSLPTKVQQIKLRMRVEALDIFWTDKSRYDLAEKRFHEVILKVTERPQYSPLVSEIAKAREHIQNSLEKIDVATLEDRWRLEFLDRISLLENQNGDLKSQVFKLNQAYTDVLKRIDMVENRLNFSNGNLKEDDVDLFASDSEEETKEAVRIREERLAAYKAKKSNKAIIVAKSSLILDVKPWDDETDLLAMEIEIRKIALEGLLWGASKLVPVAFGIKKLSISCVVEDDKVSIDWLTEEIEKLEDFVQSVDIATFNKI